MATIQTFKGVVRLTKAQLDTLMNTGSLSDGTTTITYDPETTIYLTPQERASTSEAGVILIATDQDVQTGTNTTKAVTPAQLKTLINELSDVQQDVADNMTDISGLKEDNTTNKANISQLQSNTSAINSTLNKTEQVEVIYDKDGGSQLDMNHSGGIYGGTWNVFTIDTKYRRVRVYAILNTREVVFEIDLTPIKEGWTTTTSATGLTKNQNLTGNNAYVFYGVLAEIDSGFNFIVRECFSCNVVTDDYAQFQEDTSYYVYRVEGVL